MLIAVERIQGLGRTLELHAGATPKQGGYSPTMLLQRFTEFAQNFSHWYQINLHRPPHLAHRPTTEESTKFVGWSPGQVGEERIQRNPSGIAILVHDIRLKTRTPSVDHLTSTKFTWRSPDKSARPSTCHLIDIVRRTGTECPECQPASQSFWACQAPKVAPCRRSNTAAE